MQRMLFFTFEGFSWLEQQGSLCKLIIRTCVGCAVLGAIIHLGADREQRDGKRGEASEKSRQRWNRSEQIWKGQINTKGRGGTESREGESDRERHSGRREQRVRENKRNSFIKPGPRVRTSLIIQTLKMLQEHAPCFLSSLVLSPSAQRFNPRPPTERLRTRRSLVLLGKHQIASQ